MTKHIILGISSMDMRSHDNSAAIVSNGKLLAFAEEERFISKKHAYDLIPLHSIIYCLKTANISPMQIDEIVFGWDLHNISFDNNKTRLIPISKEEIWKKLFPWESNISKNFSITFKKHHQSHAMLSYAMSGFKSSAILVIDGQGEDSSISGWHAIDGKIKNLFSIGIDQSLGYMYEGVCIFLGFKGNEAAKVMGLASYGEKNILPFDVVTITDKGIKVNFPKKIIDSVNAEFSSIKNYYETDYYRSLWIRYCEFIYGKNIVKSKSPHLDKRRDIAACLQKTLEIVVLSLVKKIFKLTKEDCLCLCGGVALNCSLNGLIERSHIYKKFYVPPISGDVGVSLGGILCNFTPNEVKTFSKKNNFLQKSASLGPSWSNHQIEIFLKDHNISYKVCDNNFSDVAKLIANGAIIGWFQGRMEMGPRALGNRSILADPRNYKNLEKINKIKKRECWRPLAPSILNGYENKYFKNGTFSPFMLKAYIVRNGVKEKIPAVVHVDGTSRYQSVCKEVSLPFWNLINSFKELTGIPMLLNTSFNIQNPIVCTPEQAILTFMSSTLDYLVIGKFIIGI